MAFEHREAVKARVRDTFNAAADHFDAAPLFFWDHLGKRTVELAGVADGEHVLDVCCGTGASALPAAAKVGPSGRVTGVDLADQLLKRAEIKAKQRGLANVKFVAGDMAALDVPDSSMDVVICVLGLYFADVLPAAVAELWRTLRPGGTLAIATWGRRSLEPAGTMYLDAVAAERPDLDVRRQTLPWARIDTPTTLTQAFVDGGARPPVITEETLVRAMTANGFWTIVLGSGYRLFIDAMSPGAALRVQTTLRDRMRRELVKEVTADVIYAVASKG